MSEASRVSFYVFKITSKLWLFMLNRIKSGLMLNLKLNTFVFMVDFMRDNTVGGKISGDGSFWWVVNLRRQFSVEQISQATFFHVEFS